MVCAVGHSVRPRAVAQNGFRTMIRASAGAEPLGG